ncbi:winged helix DNA-binding domain-containing protein [Isoptericola sp. S6320L]|uniref:winged helix DNA-binding domain-containing protein n=1 Tax=Isoptericola sp. S6320L TaxID=2926411 RepID=UPI001FF27F6F|nr:winged helix DNA-binding domain-containing protein [Isoptericola sp. S6320L]MCK0117997.1 winged helix DNA-binding domain-containing protein [Isoptericola sp. S6320L]
MTTEVTLDELGRTTLARQLLLARADGVVAEVVGAVGGLQAQHPDMPATALWARRTGRTSDLRDALADREVVRATVMRSTLHVVPAARWADLDAVSAAERLATWRASARRAGVDLVELNAEVRELCRATARTVDQIEAFAAERYTGVDVTAAVPDGVSRPWWRLASAGGGLVRVPPSSTGEADVPASYVDGATWCEVTERPDVDAARVRAVVGYLRAFGPATRADVGHGLGIRRATPLKAALTEIGVRVLGGPGGAELLDLPDGEVVPADVPVPVRFLPRWEHLLVALKDRRRFLDDAGASAVYRRNGDILPTFWADGRVAGTWSVVRSDEGAEIRLTAIGPAAAEHREAIEAEAASLATHLGTGTAGTSVRWS